MVETRTRRGTHFADQGKENEGRLTITLEKGLLFIVHQSMLITRLIYIGCHENNDQSLPGRGA